MKPALTRPALYHHDDELTAADRAAGVAVESLIVQNPPAAAA